MQHPNSSFSRPESNATLRSTPHSHSCCCTVATDTAVFGGRTPHEADSSLPSMRRSTLAVGNSQGRNQPILHTKSEVEDTNKNTTCPESLLRLNHSFFNHRRNDPSFAETRRKRASGGETRVGRVLGPPPSTVVSIRSAELNS